MRLPYAQVRFGEDGTAVAGQEVVDAVALVGAAGSTDVVVVSHGWNNDEAAARDLYARLLDNVAAQWAGPSAPPAVVGVVWPAVQWADDEGRALAAGDPRVELRGSIVRAADDPAASAALLAAAEGVETSAQSRAEFVAALRAHLLPDPADVADDDPLPPTLLTGDADELFAAVAEAVVGLAALNPQLVPDGTGSAAGFDLSALNPLSIARALVNGASYYRMKERAGAVGQHGVADLVRRLDAETPARVTLVGHSFGARVVASAASTGAPVHAMCLLQGAFSHFGFSSPDGPLGRPGAFRGVVDNGSMTGPVIVTHTRNDRAVGLAYAVASRIARQMGSGLGDHEDPYGGIGSNGALGLADGEVDDSVRLGHAGTAYDFTGARVHNLRSDDFVAGHSEVTGPEVANAVRQAVLA